MKFLRRIKIISVMTLLVLGNMFVPLAAIAPWVIAGATEVLIRVLPKLVPYCTQTIMAALQSAKQVARSDSVVSASAGKLETVVAISAPVVSSLVAEGKVTPHAVARSIFVASGIPSSATGFHDAAHKSVSSTVAGHEKMMTHPVCLKPGSRIAACENALIRYCPAPVISKTSRIMGISLPTMEQLRHCMTPSKISREVLVRENNYMQALNEKFAQPGMNVDPIPGGVMISNFDRTVYTTVRLVDNSIRDAQLAMKMAFNKMLVGMRNNAALRHLINDHVKDLSHYLMVANGQNKAERLLALYKLPGVQSDFPLVRVWFNTVKQRLLRENFSNNGVLNLKALMGESKFVAHQITSFVQHVKPCLDNVTYNEFLDAASRVDAATKEGLFDGAWRELYAMNAPADIGVTIMNSETNKKIAQCFDACLQYDFEAAQKIMDQASGDTKQAMQIVFDHCYAQYAQQLKECAEKAAVDQQVVKQYTETVFDQHGVYIFCTNDPLYRSLSVMEKEALVHDAQALEAFNAKLVDRYAFKQKLQEAWGIADNSPAAVHDALYGLLDDDARALSNPLVLLDKAVKLAEVDDVVKQAFFSSNGVFKDFAHYARAQSLYSLPDLDKEKWSPIVCNLNYLLYLEQGYPGTDLAKNATRGLDCLVSYAGSATVAQIESALQDGLISIKPPIVRPASPEERFKARRRAAIAGGGTMAGVATAAAIKRKLNVTDYSHKPATGNDDAGARQDSDEDRIYGAIRWMHFSTGDGPDNVSHKPTEKGPWFDPDHDPKKERDEWKNLPPAARVKKFQEVVERLKKMYKAATIAEALQVLKMSEESIRDGYCKASLSVLEWATWALDKINSNPLWEKFKYDAAKGGTVDIGSIEEALSGIACETQGLLEKLTRSSERAVEFLDKCKIGWDVKSAWPYLSRSGERVVDFGRVIIRMKEGYAQGEHIILNITRLNSDELEHLCSMMQEFTKAELDKTIVIDYLNPARSMASEALIKKILG